MSHPTVAELRRIDLFTELDDTQLQRWTDVAQVHEFSPGEIISEQGQDERGVTLLIDGRVELLIRDGEVEDPLGYNSAPTWIGAIPTLLQNPSQITMRADTDVRLALVAPEDFIELTLSQRSVFNRAMAQMRPVISRFTEREQQRERLESLGTMSAGLAHELNNPAAAAKRAAAELADTLEVLTATVGLLVESGIEREQAGELVVAQREAAATATQPTPRSVLDAADAEDELSDALADAGVSEPWRISEPLSTAGIDARFVSRVAAVAGPATEPALRWIAASLNARELSAELSESTDRMSRLVTAIKSYAYMDRGEVVQVDVREGLETTLTILGHKLKHTEIQVKRDYDESLPRLMVHGAELNQVWTNLLDNAIDALGDSGQIAITTRAAGDCAEIDIADDGPGIPADIRDRVFDPFFTTKEVGKGTGLGLQTARRIIVDRHRGSLTFESDPGPPARTVFHVRLPIDGTRR